MKSRGRVFFVARLFPSPPPSVVASWSLEWSPNRLVLVPHTKGWSFESLATLPGTLRNNNRWCFRGISNIYIHKIKGLKEKRSWNLFVYHDFYCFAMKTGRIWRLSSRKTPKRTSRHPASIHTTWPTCQSSGHEKCLDSCWPYPKILGS